MVFLFSCDYKKKLLSLHLPCTPPSPRDSNKFHGHFFSLRTPLSSHISHLPPNNVHPLPDNMDSDEVRLDTERLCAALKLGGVVPPTQIDPVVGVSDVATRVGLFGSCLLAIGDDFVGHDLAPLRETSLSGAATSARQHTIAACLFDMGLVPNISSTHHPARRTAQISTPATLESCLALISGECRREPLITMLHSLIDVLEVCVHAPSAQTLEDEFSRCSSLQAAALRDSRAVFSKQCSILPQNVTVGEKTRARVYLEKGGGVAVVRQQNEVLQGEVQVLREKLRMAGRAEGGAGLPMTPEVMAAKHAKWRAAVADLLAQGNSLVGRAANLQLPEVGQQEDAADQLAAIAASISSRAAALAALPSAASQIRTSFAEMESLTRTIESTAATTPADHSWARQYAAMAP